MRIATHEAERWTSKVARWDPEIFFEGRNRASRAQARPKKRWCDDLEKFVKSQKGKEWNWKEAAKNKSWWEDAAVEFVKDSWRK